MQIKISKALTRYKAKMRNKYHGLLRVGKEIKLEVRKIQARLIDLKYFDYILINKKELSIIK